MRAPRAPALAGLVVLAVVAVWLPALWGGFVWDDHYDLVDSPRLHRLGAVVDVFRHDAMWSADQPPSQISTYRPLALATLAVDYALYGRHPLGYHASSILLHVLATLAVLLALGRLTGSPTVAAALGFLCAAHPADVEAVAWINGRSEILALGFGALGLWAAATRHWIIMAVALLAALLGKETGLVFVVLAAAAGCIEPDGAHARPRWPAFVASLAALAGYALLRAMALGSNTVPGGSFARALAALPAVWLRATQEAALPLERAMVTLSHWLAQLGDGEIAAYWVAAGALLALGAFLIWRRQLRAALGLAWWLGGLVPLATIAVLRYPWPGLARWVYVGLPGLALFVWYGALHRLQPLTQLIAFAVAATASVVATERAIPVWHDDIALYATMVEESPDDVWALRALGVELLTIGRYADAVEFLSGAAARDPTNQADADLIAYAWTYLGRCDDALELYRAHPPTSAVRPDRFAYLAGNCYARAGAADRARWLWSICAPTNPSCVTALATGAVAPARPESLPAPDRPLRDP
jgi:tetratricopeptide (TPR) repeat protein